MASKDIPLGCGIINPYPILSRITTVNRGLVEFWLFNEVFCSALKRKIYSGTPVGLSSFYETAVDVYEDELAKRESGIPTEFRFRPAEASLKSMRLSLQNGYDDSDFDPSLWYDVRKHVNAPYDSLHYWFLNKDFNSEMKRLSETGNGINDRSAYEVMKRIYNDRAMHRIQDGMPFDYRKAKVALKRIAARLNMPDPIPKPYQDDSDRSSD